ncbi:MAG: hypothetical protein JWL88_285 [Parcubacteria group bacterium]|nr:hypothetical protein [Parcubacteria group bacterium]
MSWFVLLNQIVLVVGIPTIIAALVFVGRKLEILGRLEKSIDGELRPDLKDVRERIFVLEGKMSNLLWMYQK